MKFEDFDGGRGLTAVEAEEEEGSAAGPETILPAFRDTGPPLVNERSFADELDGAMDDVRCLVFAVRSGPMLETRRGWRLWGASREAMGRSRDRGGSDATRGAKRLGEGGAL